MQYKLMNKLNYTHANWHSITLWSYGWSRKCHFWQLRCIDWYHSDAWLFSWCCHGKKSVVVYFSNWTVTLHY